MDAERNVIASLVLGLISSPVMDRSIKRVERVAGAERGLACVASVSVGFPQKFRCYGRAKIGARAKKKEGGGGEEKRKRLQSNPLEFENPVRQRTGLVIGSALVLIIDMSHQRSDFARIQHGRRKGRRVPSTFGQSVKFSLRTGI